jgi:hypothetical protein
MRTLFSFSLSSFISFTAVVFSSFHQGAAVKSLINLVLPELLAPMTTNEALEWISEGEGNEKIFDIDLRERRKVGTQKTYLLRFTEATMD